MKKIEAEIYVPWDDHSPPHDRFDTHLFYEIVELFEKDKWNVDISFVTPSSEKNENPEHPVCADVLIFRNPDDGGVFVISFQDMPAVSPKLAEQGILKGASFTHYSPEWIIENLPNHRHLIHPGYYFPMHPGWIEEHRKLIKPTFEDRRMFFAGTTGMEEDFRYTAYNGEPRRKIAHILADKYPDKMRLLTREDKLERREWWKEASKHYINLSFPGHPWCNREFELWGLGLPVMASQWTNLMINNPIPNYHYFSPYGGEQDYNGVAIDAEFAADQIAEYYDLIIDNEEFIRKVARQGQEFYDRYISIEHAAKEYYNLIQKSELF